MNLVNGASARSVASFRPKKSVFRCDHTTPTLAIGWRSTRNCSFCFAHRITGPGVVHPAVLVISGNVMPPRLDSCGYPRDHPHPNFGRGLARNAIVPGTGLMHRHAFRSQSVPAQHPVNSLPSVSILLEAGVVVAWLVIEHENACALRHRAPITERTRQCSN
jgi:hypothetical protein